MKYIVTYTSYDRSEFDEMSAEYQAERTHVKEFTSKNKALGFCEGVETLNGTILKKEKSQNERWQARGSRVQVRQSQQGKESGR